MLVIKFETLKKGKVSQEVGRKWGSRVTREECEGDKVSEGRDGVGEICPVVDSEMRDDDLLEVNRDAPKNSADDDVATNETVKDRWEESSDQSRESMRLGPNRSDISLRRGLGREVGGKCPYDLSSIDDAMMLTPLNVSRSGIRARFLRT